MKGVALSREEDGFERRCSPGAAAWTQLLTPGVRPGVDVGSGAAPCSPADGACAAGPAPGVLAEPGGWDVCEPPASPQRMPLLELCGRRSRSHCVTGPGLAVLGL